MSILKNLYCGYFPLQWMRLIAENQSPHSTSKAAILIWHRAGVERKGDRLTITRQRAMDCVGLSSNSLIRGLKELERLGLIQAERIVGKAPRVTIVNYESYKRLGKSIEKSNN